MATSALGVVFVTSFAERTPPLDLTSVGLPGCNSYLFAADSSFAVPSNGVATWTRTLPSNPALSGLGFVQQALVVDSNAANPAGALVTNAARAMLGNS